MYHWLIFSIGLFLLLFIYVVYYVLQIQFMVRATLAYPEVNAEIGSPRSIMDISRQQNSECYQAFNKFCAQQRYLDADIPVQLAERFVSLEKTKKKGLRFTWIIIANFAACLAALLFLK
ncbi:hypothetical protein [Psychromonas aquimarina]|uniref:hypothetical protein n=1 Tax=Psychromonas aquimarina TaxID=444919 RepID=UPI0003FA7F61|nr:hypothetical protein [Psychromonas aquimarina]